MITLGVVCHPTHERALRTADELRALAAAEGMKVTDGESGDPVDVVVALGGDGTVLRGARVAGAHRVPLLGVNLGRVGFLSAVDRPDLPAAVRALASKQYRTEKRMMLEGVVEGDGEPGGPVVALNEIALEKAVPGRMIEVRVAVGREEVVTLRADGLMVATPTGSTAYSYSAGGPVLEPGLPAMVITAVAPHTRPVCTLVVGVERPVSLTSVAGQAALSADGRMIRAMPVGDSVTVRPHAHPLEIVQLDSWNFFERVRTRLFRTDAPSP
jgi:NAD+ kinase